MPSFLMAAKDHHPSPHRYERLKTLRDRGRLGAERKKCKPLRGLVPKYKDS